MSRTPRPLFREIACLLTAVRNCEKTGNAEWETRYRESIETLVCNYMPSGSGIDTGTNFDWDHSTPAKLVFTFGYHHMNDVGMYDGWTEHSCVVTPSLTDAFNLRITGRDRNRIKDCLAETFDMALSCQVWQTEDGEWHSTLYGEALPAV